MSEVKRIINDNNRINTIDTYIKILVRLEQLCLSNQLYDILL
jgi:hypothetical protein